MGPPFTNLFASCCTSPSFVFGTRFATPRMALGPMCHLMCWLLSCGLCCFAVLADRWQVILGEFPGRCTQCNNLALAPPTRSGSHMSRSFKCYTKGRWDLVPSHASTLLLYAALLCDQRPAAAAHPLWSHSPSPCGRVGGRGWRFLVLRCFGALIHCSWQVQAPIRHDPRHDGHRSHSLS